MKSVDRVTKAHKKQLLTYLRLSGGKVVYLLMSAWMQVQVATQEQLPDFGEALMKDGISRIINGKLE